MTPSPACAALVALMACTTAPEPAPTPAPRAEEAPARAGCALPAQRPPELTIRIRRSVVPRGKAARTGQRLVSARCASEGCEEVPPEALDAVYARLLRDGFGDLGLSGGGRASPHYGSRSITLSWGDGEECAVSDSSRRTLPDAERAVFDGLYNAIAELPAAVP